jgi:hypothetical protein
VGDVIGIKSRKQKELNEQIERFLETMKEFDEYTKDLGIHWEDKCAKDMQHLSMPCTGWENTEKLIAPAISEELSK